MLFAFLASWPFLAFQIDTACNSDRTDGLTEVWIGSIRYGWPGDGDGRWMVRFAHETKQNLFMSVLV